MHLSDWKEWTLDPLLFLIKYLAAEKGSIFLSTDGVPLELSWPLEGVSNFPFSPSFLFGVSL